MVKEGTVKVKKVYDMFSNVQFTCNKKIAPYKSLENNLVIEANDMLRIRKKISDMYANKKVIVAPCTTKLYFSNQQKLIDFDGKFSQDWCYFATGTIAIIYDEINLILKIALFEKTAIRLLWCFNWAHYAHFHTPTSNFHVINTDENSFEHVGLLYENKIVADLVLSSFKLFCDQLRADSSKLFEEKTQGNFSTRSSSKGKDNNEKVDVKCRSFRNSFRRKNLSISVENEAENKQKLSVNETNNDIYFEESRQIEQFQSDKLLNLEKCNISLRRFSRADSFRQANVDENTCKTESINETSHNKESLIKSLFKKRRVSRSQSLRSLQKRLSQASQTSQCTTEENITKEDYIRSNKLVKVRSSTDSQLVCGKEMKCIIETGNLAQQTRERKYWARTFDNKRLASTDLCITEL